MTQNRRLTPALLLMTLVCAFSFGAIVRLAFADDYHVDLRGPRVRARREPDRRVVLRARGVRLRLGLAQL